MAEWNVDEKFLDFLVKKLESEGKDMLKAIVGSSKGTSSMKDLIDEMKQGTKIGQKLYTALYNLNEKEFKDYLSNNPD